MHAAPPPPGAAKRHFRVEGLGGLDAIMDAWWFPLALKLRVLAIKILRYYGDIPNSWSVPRALLAKPRPISDVSFSLGMGGNYNVLNTRGATKRG